MNLNVTPETNDQRARIVNSIEVVPLPFASGAEIRNCDVRCLDDNSFSAIREAFQDNLVLLFREQDLTDLELMKFGRRFGKLLAALPAEHRPAGVRDRDGQLPEINIVSNVRDDSGMAIGVLGDGEARWHSDYSFYDIPLSTSVLHAWEVPAAGGETGFANMYYAYDTLPENLRQRIQGLQIKHDLSKTSVGQQRKGVPTTTDVRISPGAIHPIVRTHPETGYNALYLGRRHLAYVMGLPVDESEDLLDQLWAHATRPEFHWHHKWKNGDMIVWDNACLLHHRYAFDPGARRIMHRVQTEGSKPFFSPADGKGPHPRGMSKPA